MTSETVPATKEHARELAKLLRPSDVAEVRAESGHSPLSGLLSSMAKSSCSSTFMVDGRPVALFGVAPVDTKEGVGTAWLIATSKVDEHPLPFLRASKRELYRLLAIWPVLQIVVKRNHDRAMRWAKWLGFQPWCSLFAEDREFVLLTLRRH